MIVTMPQEVKETIIECLKEAEPVKLTRAQVMKLKAARRLIDTNDKPTPEYLQLEKELQKELGNDWFSFALEV